MACINASGASNSELMFEAHRAAREVDSEFYAAVLDARTRLDGEQVRALIDDAVLAIQLGAKIVWLESSDRVSELLEFARQSRVGRIFVARNRPARFCRLFGRSIYSELLSRGDDFRIDIVGFRRTDHLEEGRPRMRR